jgi:hypothetical protein
VADRAGGIRPPTIASMAGIAVSASAVVSSTESVPPSAIEANNGSAKAASPAMAVATARPDTATARPARPIADPMAVGTSSPAARCSRNRAMMSSE